MTRAESNIYVTEKEIRSESRKESTVGESSSNISFRIRSFPRDIHTVHLFSIKESPPKSRSNDLCNISSLLRPPNKGCYQNLRGISTTQNSHFSRSFSAFAASREHKNVNTNFCIRNLATFARDAKRRNDFVSKWHCESNTTRGVNYSSEATTTSESQTTTTPQTSTPSQTTTMAQIITKESPTSAQTTTMSTIMEPKTATSIITPTSSTSTRPPSPTPKPTYPPYLCLAGCGFMAPYMLGCVTSLLDSDFWGNSASARVSMTSSSGESHGPKSSSVINDPNKQIVSPTTESSFKIPLVTESTNLPKYIAGASAGAMLAAVLLTAKPSLQTLWDIFIRSAYDCSFYTLGPLSRNIIMQQYLRDVLQELPEDAHLMLSGRLFVSITHLRSYRNRIISEWPTREDLIECLLCSCYLPIFSGEGVPRFRGELYIDGGFTNNQPRPFEPNSFLTISPFSSTADICPRDKVKKGRYVRVSNELLLISKANWSRLYHTVMPHTNEMFRQLYHDGYSRSLLYLKDQASAQLGQ